MKIIAFSTYLATIASASASQLQAQAAQRLRGNQETRELQCTVERSSLIYKVEGDDKCRGEKGQAFKPTSTQANFSLTLDGSLDKWVSLTSCDGIPMYEAGKETDKDLVSRAYLNWDCSHGELCILVKAEEGFSIKDDTGMWFKDYDESTADQVPLNDSPVTKIYDDGTLIAWEACYSMYAACTKSVQIHANFPKEGEGAGTTSTGKPSTGTISLDLSCPCSDLSDNSACVVNACYSKSKCTAMDTCTLDTTDGSTCTSTGTTNICEYDLLYDHCCVDDQDCDMGFECGGIVNGTGTCQKKSDTTPSPTPAGTPSPTASAGTPAPTSSVISPTGNAADDCTTNPDICVLPSDAHAECADPVCSTSDTDGPKCTAQMIYAENGVSCNKTSDAEESNPCYRPTCKGTACSDDYLEDTSCEPIAIADEWDMTGWDLDSCVDFKCKPDPEGTNGRTTCQPVFHETVVECGEAPLSRGVCDSGNKCNGNGYCSDENSYKPDTVICKDSDDLCDAPEYCTGSSHTCPTDVNYGSDHVCRSECTDDKCKDDVPEMCTGESPSCPADIIFQKTLDVIAGQNYNAGSTTIAVTDLGHNITEVCIDINLSEGWELQNTDAPVKFEINTSGGIKSSPGSYSKKFADLPDIPYCIELNATTCTVYFALHLDVLGADGNTETAWAKLAASDTSGDVAGAADETSLEPHVFVKDGTKSGPKVKGGKNKQVSTSEELVEGDGVGWGNYFTFSICCATSDFCSATSPTLAPTGSGSEPTGSGSTESPLSYSCTNEVSGHSLTCEHEAAEDAAVACSNLFS